MQKPWLTRRRPEGRPVDRAVTPARFPTWAAIWSLAACTPLAGPCATPTAKTPQNARESKALPASEDAINIATPTSAPSSSSLERTLAKAGPCTQRALTARGMQRIGVRPAASSTPARLLPVPKTDDPDVLLGLAESDLYGYHVNFFEPTRVHWAHFERAYRIFRQMYGDAHKETVYARLQMIRAGALTGLGFDAEAWAAVAKAYASGINGAGGRHYGEFNRGLVLQELGRCADALGAFEAAAHLAANDDQRWDAMFGRAQCRARLGALEAARLDLAALDRLVPPDGPLAPERQTWPTWNERALLDLVAGRYESALPVLEAQSAWLARLDGQVATNITPELKALSRALLSAAERPDAPHEYERWQRVTPLSYTIATSNAPPPPTLRGASASPTKERSGSASYESAWRG